MTAHGVRVDYISGDMWCECENDVDPPRFDDEDSISAHLMAVGWEQGAESRPGSPNPYGAAN